MIKFSIIGSLFFIGTLAYAQDSPRPQTAESQTTPPTPVMNEQQISYPDEVLREELDFRLTPVSEGKFKLDIRTRTKGFFFVKVYDVIGNLLYEEQVRVRGRFQQELDMSKYDSKLFIIEVGNDELNRTKSIVAT